MLCLKNSVKLLLRKNLVGLAKLQHAVQTAEKSFEEIRIPVPWGHIAGKWWGPTDQRPIVMLHGWQDNCGTFDRLVPLLPDNLSFLAVDFPGHGLSSHLPKGMFYHGIDSAIFIKRYLY